MRGLGLSMLLTLGVTLSTTTWAGCECHVDEVKAYGKSIGTKMLLKLPLDPIADFPPAGLTSLTATEKEALRVQISKKLSKCLGEHVGWKVGVTSATPSTPALGYTQPFYGELLEDMIVVGNMVDIDPSSALLPFIETDLLFKVKSKNIMQATTPLEVLENLSGVYGAIEFASGYTGSVPNVLGPASGGQGILEVLNGGANGFVRSTKLIKIPGKRSLADWEAVLNGGLDAQDHLTRTSGNVSSTSPGVLHLDDMLGLIQRMNTLGLEMQEGDVVSPGTAVAVNLMDGTEVAYTATYNNLDPKDTLEMKIRFRSDGECFNGTKRKSKQCGDDNSN